MVGLETSLGVVLAELVEPGVCSLLRAIELLSTGPARILFRHLLPSCAGSLAVQATLLLPAFILAEATLSYVGLGFPQDIPTWGTMLADASDANVMTRFPWMLTPAAAIFLVVFSVNVLLGTRRPYVQ